MEPIFITARVLHVVCSVFWAGTLTFNAIFLAPSVREAGPDGAKVMAGLMKRRFLDVMPVVALVSILSGTYLYWHASAGFTSAYMRSSVGMAYGTGMVAAIIGFLIGVGVLRPAMLRMGPLAHAAASSAPAEKEKMMAELLGLRMRAATAGQVVAWLLGSTTVVMAVARYL